MPRLQIAADLLGAAGDRVDLGSPIAQPMDGFPQCREPINLVVDLGEPGVEEGPHMFTGRFASIADVKALLAPRAKKLAGAIAGRALYDGRLDPAEALALIRAARAAA